MKLLGAQVGTEVRRVFWWGKTLLPERTLDCPELTRQKKRGDLSPQNSKVTCWYRSDWVTDGAQCCGLSFRIQETAGPPCVGLSLPIPQPEKLRTQSQRALLCDTALTPDSSYLAF